MSFEKAAQKSPGAEIILEYQDALVTFKSACKEYTKTRLLADAPRATDEDIVAHAKALKIYKAQCKEYNLARSKFIHGMKHLSNKLPSNTDSAVLDAYENTSFTNLRKLQKEAIQQEEFQEEFKAGKFDRLIEEFKVIQAKNAAEAAEKEAAKRKVMNEVDPTTGFDSPFEETQGE